MKLLIQLTVFTILLFGVLYICKKQERYADGLKKRINLFSDSQTALFIFLVVVVLEGLQIFYKKTPFVSDEVYTLSGGAFFAGYDWSSYMSHHKFYNFGYTMLLSPLFRIIQNPIVLYRCLLGVNVLLHAITVVLAYRLMRKRFNFSNLQSIAVSFAAACCVLILQFNTYVYNETPLTFLVWVSVALMIRLVEEKGVSKIILSVLLGLSTGYAYIIHSRCVILFVSVFLILLCYLVLYRKWLANPVAFLVPFCAMILGCRKLVTYVQEYLYLKGSGVKMDNSVEAVAGSTSRYAILTSGEGIAKIIKHFFSLAGGLNIETGGFLLIITILSLYGVVKLRREFLKDDSGRRLFILTLFSFVSFWGMVACIALSGANNGRYRFLLYSRYFTPFIGPYLLMGIIMLLKNTNLKSRYLCIWTALGNLVVMLVYIFYSYPILKGADMKNNASLYVFMCFARYQKQTHFSKSVFAIAFLIMLVGSLIFLFLYQRKSAIWMCMCFLGFSVILFLNIETRQNRAASERRYQMSNASYELVENQVLADDLDVYYAGSEIFCKSVLVTLFNKDVTFLQNVNDATDLSTSVLLTNEPENYTDLEDVYVFKLDNNEYVMTKNDSAYEALVQKYALYQGQ